MNPLLSLLSFQFSFINFRLQCNLDIVTLDLMALLCYFLKGSFFFRKYDAFFSLPKKCAENYPEKAVLKLRSVQSQLTLNKAQFSVQGRKNSKYKGQNTPHFLGNGNNTNLFLRISDLQAVRISLGSLYRLPFVFVVSFVRNQAVIRITTQLALQTEKILGLVQMIQKIDIFICMTGIPYISYVVLCSSMNPCCM